MHHLSISAAFVLLTTFFACGAGARSQADSPARSAQNQPPPAAARAEATPRPDGVKLVNVEELKRLIEQGGAIALDVRGSVEYEMGHIKGARPMPLGFVAARASELPKDKLIVPYCACSAEQLSARAVLELKRQGFENVGALLGGWDAWVQAGLPVEGTNIAPQPGRPAADAGEQGGGQGGGRGGRVAPPPGLKCGLDDLTLYDGEVVKYERKAGSTFLRINTNFDTTEEVTLKHPGTDDPSALFLVNTEPFRPEDWQKIEAERRKLRPGMRANVWVCVGDPSVQPVVDWRPDDTGANPRSR
ncbi:MAG TPA: rhodanese-like domain-containing protein [Pyrinomonadaceae bacterium]|jgi:rhodanese-related sulfurtransferase